MHGICGQHFWSEYADTAKIQFIITNEANERVERIFDIDVTHNVNKLM